jgi:hypothetical protein
MVDCGSISGGSGKKFAGSDTPGKPLLESHRGKSGAQEDQLIRGEGMMHRKLGTRGPEVSALGLGYMGLNYAYGPALGKKEAISPRPSQRQNRFIGCATSASTGMVRRSVVLLQGSSRA